MRFESSFKRVKNAFFLILLICAGVVGGAFLIFAGTSRFFHEKQYELSLLLKEKLGVQMSYEELSPSLLSVLRLNGLKLYDANTNSPILSISTIEVRYNLFSMIFGNIPGGIKEVTVDSGLVYYNEEQHITFRTRLEELFRQNLEMKAKMEKTETVEEPKKRKEFALKLLDLVRIQNFTIAYENSVMAAHVTLGELRIVYSPEAEQLNFFVSSRANARFKATEIFSEDSTNLKFSFSGRVSQDFSDLSGRMNFDTVQASAFILRNVVFNLDYNQNKFTMDLIQPRNQYRISAAFDVPQKDLTFSFETEDFNPNRILASNQQIKQIEDAKMDLKFDFHGNFLHELRFDYSASGDIAMPLSMGGAFDANFSLFGDDQGVTFDNFSAILPNTGVIEGMEIYVNFLDRGAVAYVPELVLGAQRFADIQAQLASNATTGNMEFSFAMVDANRANSDYSGEILLEGVIAGETSFLQAELTLSQIFTDSLLRTVDFFLPLGSSIPAAVMETTSEYIMSNSVYVSCNLNKNFLETLSFSLPAGLLVSTKQEENNAIFALSGGSSGVTISRCDLFFGGQTFSVSGDFLTTSDLSEVNASLLLSANAFDYNLSATYIKDQSISVYGDYGILASVDLGNTRAKNGTILLGNVPIHVGQNIFELTGDAYFTFGEEQPLYVNLSNFVVSEVSGNLTSRPRLQVEGSVEGNFGEFLLDYTDSYSALLGNATVSWEFMENSLNTLIVSMNLQDNAGLESLFANFFVANTKGWVDIQSPIENYQISGTLGMTNLRFSHFLSGQKSTDTVSAIVEVGGMLSSPEISAEIENANFSNNKAQIKIAGGVGYMEGLVTTNALSMSYVAETLNIHQSLHDITTAFFIRDFSGIVSARYFGFFDSGEHTVEAPIQIALSSVMNENRKNSGDFLSRFERLNLEVSINGITGNFFEPMPATSVSLVKHGSRFEVSGGYENSIEGFFDTATGKVRMDMRQPFPVNLTATGEIVGNLLDIDVEGIYVDLSKFSLLINFPFIRVNASEVTGYMHIGGNTRDPDFTGEAFAADTNLSVPQFVSEELLCDSFYASIERNQLFVNQATFRSSRAVTLLDLTLTMDRWLFDNIELKITTQGDSRVAAHYEMPVFEVSGMGSCDLHLKATMTSVSVSGNIYVENADGVFVGTTMPPQDPNAIDSIVDLNFEIGPKTQVYFPSKRNPIVRGIVEPRTPMSLKYDSTSGLFEMKGDLQLRGGEFVYVNRNFTLKEGRVLVDASETYFDPLITLVAEIKERDELQKPVTITLSAENQRFSELSPKFTANPPKNENEINRILGQIFWSEDVHTENQWSSMLASAADYGVQSLFFREIETRLRNTLNVDLFSMRIPIVQNTIMQLLDQNYDGTDFNFGNFFKNTTVYIGKYFGDNIYGSLSLTLEQDELTNVELGRQLNVIPAIGLEMQMPYNLVFRWSLAPDFSNINDKNFNLVEYTSFGISWKWSF